MRIKNLFTYWANQALFPEAALKEKYEAFQALLEQDKQAHEHMATLETFYHDQVRADIAAIEHQYNALATCVERIVDQLNVMHPTRYTDLKAIFKRICGYARHMFPRPETMQNLPTCVDLRSGADAGEQLVGGKAMHLAMIGERFGLPIPDGFVITTAAHDQVIQDNGLRPEIEAVLRSIDLGNPRHLMDRSTSLQDMILQASLPPAVEEAILAMVARIFKGEGAAMRLAVRSSAVGEDGPASFAGQYQSLLNVTEAGLLNAYKTVLASKYAPEALVYRINYGFSDMETPMAVMVIGMVDAASSGVMYTRSPHHDNADLLEIHSVMGLGEMLVQGESEADRIIIQRGQPPVIIERRPGSQREKYIPDPHGSLKRVPITEETGESIDSLSEENAIQLAQWGMALDKQAGTALDIEWCLDQGGKLILLQSRQLKSDTVIQETVECRIDPITQPVLVAGAQRAASGVASGSVYVAPHAADLENVPTDAILVTPSASTQNVRVIASVRAVICETGSVAGHFASVAREFGVPTIVNAKNAPHALTNGMTVTVHADEGMVYAGTVTQLLETPCVRKGPLDDRPLNRKLGFIMEFVSPLRLIDPDADTFSPEGCRSLHDIVRYAHEAATREMFTIGDRKFGKGRGAKKLVSDIPMLIYLMDVEGGLNPDADNGKTVTLDDVVSAPFKAVWKGLTHPNVQWGDFTHFNWAEYDKIVMSGGIISAESAQLASYAVLASNYLNLNLKFGYHFVVLDTICGAGVTDNHILFRFNGGGGDVQGRSLRAEFLHRILDRLGFEVTRTRELVDARLVGGSNAHVSETLDMLGRLLGATRLMDMYMSETDQIDPYVEDFFKGRYHFSSVEMDQAQH